VFHNKRAFDQLVRKYQSPVRRFFLNQTLGDAQLSDDLAQETFIKAYMNITKFRGLSSFSTWLMRIAYNVFYDEMRKRKVESEELKENMLHPNKVLTSGAAAMMMSDVYLHMGFVNMSQRAAFEVMMSSPNYNMSGRELSRLVETNLITGQYEVALKYISLLEHTLFYRSWAKQMRQLATNPELIKRSPKYGSLQEVYQQTVDVFFF
jgi:RNA polymerase sigma factor (sigma-70 family)